MQSNSGAVKGGRLIADWPGLGKNDLYEGRDLHPTTDLRTIFKGMLTDHLHLLEAYVSKQVLPGSAAAKPIEGLVRS